MSIGSAALTLGAWLRARRLDALRDQDEMERIQSRWLARHLAYVALRSPYYNGYAGKPLKAWPVIGKAQWLTDFDTINTVGARLQDVQSIALRAETTRDFAPTWNGCTVGLSTGTSGSRALFLVSPQERARWAGTVLARVLRGPLWANERIALVLRAGSTLYESVRMGRRQFRYFDPLKSWQTLCDELAEFDPAVLVGPAQLLARLASEPTKLAPRRLISVAEVLDDIDRARIEARFATKVEQIYQATEGFLGSSCDFRTMHLNEPWILVEREWQDDERTRFVPIITDLWRRTQPVIRYRLDDVLRVAPAPCPCGRLGTALSAIEGRSDDMLMLDGERGAVAVFADQLARQIVCALPELDDYAVTETSRGHWTVALRPLPAEEGQRQVRNAIHSLASHLGGAIQDLTFIPLPTSFAGLQKQRRIRGLGTSSCAS